MRLVSCHIGEGAQHICMIFQHSIVWHSAMPRHLHGAVGVQCTSNFR